jgi:hypothetical protein
MQQCPLTRRWSRTVVHRGRPVFAMDCALAGAESHRGRPLNKIYKDFPTL